ncbi:MAG TPA: ABC transporter permease [Puia sp.]|jgi:putative ABC transport system permease protein|nr:ABC transporter permease [Puia sp.]
MLRNYFLTAIRNLRRNTGYSIVHIAGLSLGLACVMLILLYVKDETSFDRWHAKAERLYRVARRHVTPDGKPDNSGYTGIFQGPRFAAGVPGVEGFTRFEGGYVNVRLGTGIQSQEVKYVDSAFLTLFTFPLLGGDAVTALRMPNSVVISEDVARREFGSSEALGKTLFIQEGGDFEPHVVTGVARRCPENSSLKWEVLLPYKVTAEEEAKNANWFNFNLSTFLLLSPKADIAMVEKRMNAVFLRDAAPSIQMVKEKFGIMEIGISYFLQPLTDVHLGKLVHDNGGLADSSSPMYSYILSGIALFVLLIACINFINLTIARSLKRAKEIGIRKVIGGERRQLIGQFLGESGLLCLVAFVLAIGLAWLALPVFNRLSNKALALSYLFDARLVVSYCLLFIFTVLLAGFYPALLLSGFNPVQILYNRTRLGGKGYLQKGLVVLQFALSSFLIIATLTVYKQFNFLKTQDPGYDDSGLMVVDKPMLTRAEFKLFKQELAKNPAIVGVAASNSGYWWQTVKTHAGGKLININYETIDTGYFSLLKVPVIAGRNFSAEFPGDSAHSILVNETFVKQAGWRQPIGEQVDFIGSVDERYTVIGVVKDYHFEPMTKLIQPQLFTMKPANSFGLMYVRIMPERITAASRAVQSTFARLFPMDSWNYSYKEEDNRNSYATESKWRDILLYASILTIFISSIGLFGLSVLSAERRIKEIGIRRVLGASVSRVVLVLTRDFLQLVGIALLIAMPLAGIVAGKWLENYPYRITVTWTLFGIAGALVLLIAAVTVSFQSIRAALGNPATSLRSE